MRPWRLLVSCEHGGNGVPSPYASLFAGAEAVLQSHRAFDRGALDVARYLVRFSSAELFASTTSRLLIDLNRSPHHPKLFSEFSRPLPNDAKQRVIERYYTPHRERLENRIRVAIDAGEQVVHVAVHSFTPVLHGIVRQCDVGLLYDPARLPERRLADHWLGRLRQQSSWRLRRNYPYRGVADGFPTYLRRIFPANLYAGFELELNQRCLGDNALMKRRLCEDLCAAIMGYAQAVLEPAASE